MLIRDVLYLMLCGGVCFFVYGVFFVVFVVVGVSGFVCVVGGWLEVCDVFGEVDVCVLAWM